MVRSTHQTPSNMEITNVAPPGSPCSRWNYPFRGNWSTAPLGQLLLGIVSRGPPRQDVSANDIVTLVAETKLTTFKKLTRYRPSTKFKRRLDSRRMGGFLVSTKSAQRWPSMHKVPGSDPSSESDFSRKISGWRFSWSARDSIDTTTDISKAAGVWSLSMVVARKKIHLSID